MKPTPHLLLAFTDSTSYPIASFFELLFQFAVLWASLRLFQIGEEIRETLTESKEDAAFEDCARLAEEAEPPQSPAMHAASHPAALAARDQFMSNLKL